MQSISRSQRPVKRAHSTGWLSRILLCSELSLLTQDAEPSLRGLLVGRGQLQLQSSGGEFTLCQHCSRVCQSDLARDNLCTLFAQMLIDILHLVGVGVLLAPVMYLAGILGDAAGPIAGVLLILAYPFAFVFIGCAGMQASWEAGRAEALPFAFAREGDVQRGGAVAPG